MQTSLDVGRLKTLWPTAVLLRLFNFPDSIYYFTLLHSAYLREAADEAAASAGVSVQAVVEEASVTDGHVLKADVKFSGDAGPQVGAAAHELRRGGNRDAGLITSHVFCVQNSALLASILKLALTILMNADRKTMTMVKTPTRVLFSRDCTILLEMVCRGTGKTWECGENQQNRGTGKYQSLKECC